MFQKQMLFPASRVEPVPVTWRPSGSAANSQAFISGQCGKLHLAKWAVNSAKGTILMYHGNGESLASIDTYAMEFNQLGYNLVAWDFPGYGQSEDCWFSQEDLIKDAEAVYQWTVSQEAPDRVIIFGYSIGSGLALATAVKHAQNPVYLVSPYDSLVNVVNQRIPHIFPTALIMRYPLDTWLWVSQIKQPILIIHGTEDALISPERSQQLVDSSHGKAKLELVKGAGHADFTLSDYRYAWLKRDLPQ